MLKYLEEIIVKKNKHQLSFFINWRVASYTVCLSQLRFRLHTSSTTGASPCVLASGTRFCVSSLSPYTEQRARQFSVVLCGVGMR